jgi:ArsR family transcriptional regulator, arsenate/arsenite/antimonite-responsive transcriptional repressor / arsenate reductase (thioredoxin)
MVTNGTVAGPPRFLGLADHPVRWRLLTELGAGDLRVRELVDRVGEPQNLVSYHLRQLRDEGLVRARRSSHDGRDTYYHLDLDCCADALAATGAALHPWLRASASTVGGPTRTAPRVLFVCTGNSTRSPIAEALLRSRTEGRATVTSAGLSPKDGLHPHALRVLRERYGIDVHDQVPRSIDQAVSLARGFDRVVTLCDKAREQLPDREDWHQTHWSIPDPADPRGAARYASFVTTAADIDTRVRHLIPTLEVGL